MRNHRVKPFANPYFREVFFGYVHYYGFIRHTLKALLLSTLPMQAFSLLTLHLQDCFSCSFDEPKQSSCRLYTGCRIVVIARSRQPLDFDTVKVIFDTSITIHLRSAPLFVP
jgi:hypothetical protein